MTIDTQALARTEDARVLHYIQRWLPLSEPFVYGLVTRSAFPGVVVATRPFENLGEFPYEPRHSLGPIETLRFRRPLTTTALLLLALRHSAKLVHVHHGYVADDVTGLCRRRGLPLVLSLHGHDVTGLVERHPTIYRDVRAIVDAVIVPSRFLASLAEAAGFPGHRIHAIPSGVDMTRFVATPLPDGPRQVLFVGRFVEKKGLDVLLSAWPRVRAQVPDATLRLLGFGPLEGLARSGQEGVEVVLNPTHDLVRDAMRRAYAVVSPSRTAPDDSVESLLVVNLEAQASGRPVVTTNHGGIPEFVRDGETALVVREADAEALAAALLRVLTDETLAKRLAGSGPEWVRQFDVRRCAERVDNVYRSVVAHSRKAYSRR